ncbi:Myosin-binding protein 7 [Forsythia ovata]|uniref:Myosin-binding protein 7 n=1 Tax=Forsythia ovata TaxID=205694 RepID=A0ABD1PJ85_9LAMI
MDSEGMPPSISLVECCGCGCSCSMMNRSFSGTHLRTVKRKFDEFKEENHFTVPGLILPQNARVEIGNECMALRETVSSQQQTIQDLVVELEEERNAASSAANEAMSMILRLQREKAEIQMEAKQFKRFVEEKMAHDQQELFVLEDLLYKREQSIQSLTCEVQAYKHRMMSYGLSEAEADGENSMSRNNSMTENLDGQFELPPYELYPPLKCYFNESRACPDGDDEVSDVEKYAFGETPRSQVQLKDLEYRIDQLEKSPKNIQPEAELVSAKNMLEKVIVGQSPRRPRHSRKFSNDSSNSLFETGKDLVQDSVTDSPKFGGSFKNGFSQMENSNLRKVDNASEVGDDMSDRVYTIDSVHQEAPYNGLMEPKAPVGMGDDYMTTPRESLNYSDVKDLEIQKLYARLQALEADRESMRQAIISIGTDKAQFVLLKEIAQNLCKEMTPQRRMPVKKPSVVGSFSFTAIFKWIISFVFWRRKARRCRYMFGSSGNNAGLLMLLDKGTSCGAVEMSFKHTSVKPIPSSPYPPVKIMAINLNTEEMFGTQY